MFSEFCSISALSCSFEFELWWVVMFPVITLSQPNYIYAWLAVGVVVVVGLWQQQYRLLIQLNHSYHIHQSSFFNGAQNWFYLWIIPEIPGIQGICILDSWLIVETSNWRKMKLFALLMWAKHLKKIILNLYFHI